jgi:uncharacterized damage-inducible protein DinB
MRVKAHIIGSSVAEQAIGARPLAAEVQCERNADMTANSYATLIRFKQWADLGLHGAIAESFDRLDAMDQMIVPLVLDHFHVVDRIFQHHLQGLPHGFHGPRSEVTPSLAQLAEDTRRVDAWYVDYVDSLAASAFDEPLNFVFTSGKPARMTRGEIILHVCLHGTYHRGNVGILLQKCGAPSYPDGVTDYLASAA